MNVQLYNTLQVAHDFFLKNEKEYKPKIQFQLNVINRLSQQLNYKPTYQSKPISWTALFFWSCVFFPVAIIMILTNIIKSYRAFKKAEASFDPVAHRQKITDMIKIEEAALNEIKAQRERHYCRCRSCVLALPEALRHLEAVQSLMHYVKNGMANTINEAWKYYSQDLREMYAWEQEREERETRERQHRETQDALNTIAKNQEHIHDELKAERAWRETHRW